MILARDAWIANRANTKLGLFGKSRFRYDAAKDAYVCLGNLLRRRRDHPHLIVNSSIVLPSESVRHAFSSCHSDALEIRVN